MQSKLLAQIARLSRLSKLGVLASCVVLIGCNDQPTGRDFAAPAAPIAANPMPAAPSNANAAPTESAEAARVALLKSKMAKPQLIGAPFEDALQKLQPGQHFRFVTEFSAKDDSWRAIGQSNGSSMAYQLVTKSENFAGDWLVGTSGEGGGYFRTGQQNYQQKGFQPELAKRMLRAIREIPSSAAALQRLKDDFAGGSVAAKFTSQTPAGTLEVWLDERKSEFRKLTLLGADQSLLSIEFSQIGEPQVLPSPPKPPPW